MSEARVYLHELYALEIDRVDQQQWNNILLEFDDANLMQTWAYGSGRWGQDDLSHILLRNKDGEIVSAAQVVTKTVPFVGAGLSYVRGGPLWRLRGREINPEILPQMLRALREIFVNRRGLLLQIFPPGTEDGSGVIRQLFAEEGFKPDPTVGSLETVLIDLSSPIEDLRRSLRPTWRRNLVLAERNNLRIRCGTSDELFRTVVRLYGEMLHRRRALSPVSISSLQKIQRGLPEKQKMSVMVCEYQGEPISGIAVPWLGNTAQALLSGTGDKGLKLRGSYFLHWQMLMWLKEQGCRWYDLDGINRDARPGLTQFKLGLAGRLGLQTEHFGRFETCQRRTSLAFIKMGLRLKTAYRDMKVALGSSVPAPLLKPMPEHSLRKH